MRTTQHALINNPNTTAAQTAIAMAAKGRATVLAAQMLTEHSTVASTTHHRQHHFPAAYNDTYDRMVIADEARRMSTRVQR